MPEPQRWLSLKLRKKEMTLNELILAARMLSYNLSGGGIPLCHNGKEIDFKFTLDDKEMKVNVEWEEEENEHD